jgi:hypothetical protein
MLDRPWPMLPWSVLCMTRGPPSEVLLRSLMEYEPFRLLWIPIHVTITTFASLDCGHQSDRGAFRIAAGRTSRRSPRKPSNVGELHPGPLRLIRPEPDTCFPIG